MNHKGQNDLLHARLLAAVMGALFVVSGTVFATSDDGGELSEFNILIETTKTEIRLSCTVGCAWEGLSFSDTVYPAPQAIDRAGMTSFTPGGDDLQSGPGAFMFTIVRSDHGIRLEGILGTAWTQLSFSCPDTGCRQLIDQHGMAESSQSR